jgi:lysophospholipase L1-like esterase
MKLSHLKKFIIPPVLAALAACGGGGGSGGSTGALIPAHGPGPQTSILSRIVGVGDSLTAGYQSNGFLGETGVTNPFFVPNQIPPNQATGFWADLVEQASGLPLDTAVAQMFDPATSPLPLIKGPGLNNQIVPYQNLFFPIIELKSGDVCTDNNGFNQAGFTLRASARVRLNPTSTTIRNVGIPGLTMHEANVLHQPQTDTCKQLPGVPGLLSLVVQDESGTFWPVLRNFTKLGPNLTDVNAAASLHPTLATVWLGANDVLKYMGSGGRFVGGNRTPGQASSDITAAVKTLQRAGAHVVVANLPNILETGFFQRVTTPQKLADCRIRTYAYCLLAIEIPRSTVQSFLPSMARKYHLDTPNGCMPASETEPCGYLTLSAVTEIVTYFNTTGEGLHVPNLDCAVPSPTCKPVPGSGLGSNYITPEFAGKIQRINDAMNQGIDSAATSSHVAFVDVQSIFHGLASGDPENPYFHLAASIKPGLCCTLGYLWGILSFDGLHPSNTGYGLIAYAFINEINKTYGTHIPQIDLRAVYDGSRCSNKRYCFPDPYAPPNDSPYSP